MIWRRVAARQQRFMAQMLGNEGAEAPLQIHSKGIPFHLLAFRTSGLADIRLVSLLAAFPGGEKPDSGLAVTSAAHKLCLAATQPELIQLRPGKYTFNSSMMPTTPQVRRPQFWQFWFISFQLAE